MTKRIGHSGTDINGCKEGRKKGKKRREEGSEGGEGRKRAREAREARLTEPPHSYLKPSQA